MSKRITVSVPDDVAERLSAEENVSAYVADAVRRRMRHETTRSMLVAAGFALTDEGMARARERLSNGRAAMTPDVLEQGRRMLDELRPKG
ncbi:hypothetical protein [Luedemannella helvata]|uniref:CopG family transcriptional regulator n=1 Tax=Luedemannella helvata TaxID=349315 RepID=A0ABP4WVB7_9ACTN